MEPLQGLGSAPEELARGTIRFLAILYTAAAEEVVIVVIFLVACCAMVLSSRFSYMYRPRWLLLQPNVVFDIIGQVSDDLTG
jgi:hypothetical protein